MASALFRSVAAVHRVLLRAYGRDFRDRFESELQLVFESRLADRRRRPGAAAAFVLMAWLDTLISGLRQRLAGSLTPWAALDGLAQDVPQALRMVRRSPFLSLTAVVALAIGMGLAIAGFTVVKSEFYSVLPGPYGERVVAIQDYNRTAGWDLSVDYEEFTRRQAVSASFEAIAAYRDEKLSVSDRIVDSAFVTPNAFDVIGVATEAGRLFVAADAVPGSAAVVLLRAPLAAHWFGTSADAIGRTLRIEGELREIVGVIPASCRFPFRQDLWLPLGAGAPSDVRQQVSLFGRLKTGVTPAMAAAEFDVLASRNPRRPPDATLVAEVEPFARAQSGPEERFIAMASIVGLVLLLLVFAGNVANLMLARTAARRRELAVRAALGASRGRLVRQLAIEVLCLAMAAAAAGLIASDRLVALAQGGEQEYYGQLRPDAAVIGWVLLLAALVTVVAGILPAWRVVSTQRTTSLNREDAALAFGRVSAVLVVVEVAIAVGLLGGASALGQGLLRFSFDRFHFDESRFAVSQLYFGQPPNLSSGSTPRTPEARRAIWQAFRAEIARSERALIQRLERANGVRVSRSSHFPGNDTPYGGAAVDGSPTRRSRVVEIDEQFFEALGAPVVRGRDFSARDVDERAPVAIVNTPFERRFFGGGSAIGRRVRVNDEAVWREIVGVVPDLALNPGTPAEADGVYIPLQFDTVVRLGIRTEHPERLAIELHDAIAGLPVVPQVQWTRSLADQMRETQRVLRFIGSLLLAAGGSALLLACAGIYAVVAFGVAARRREIAIRLAIGASGAQVVRAIAGRTLLQLAAGLFLGLGMAWLTWQLVALMPTPVATAGPGMVLLTIGTLIAAGGAALARPIASALTIRPTDWLRES